MEQIGDWMAEIMERPDDEELRESVRGQVTELCRSFPLYPDLAATPRD
jgi:glycine/serine hydroxymethyltransferase